MIRYTGHRQGFIAMVSLILLLIFGILGIFYWMSSRMTTDMILTEAHRIKARNFAQAGIEKVKINICNQYNMNNHDLNYPSKFTRDRIDEEYHKVFADGEYRVISVKPYERSNLSYYNVPHYQKGVMIGHYDIWEVKSQGKVKQTGVTAELTSLIKIYRDYVTY
ncbi:MAG: hypothetical protein PWR01_3623 [Clostridiales bacterium]|jgi:hypothetical protein|nr:hypothetical protein [Clostridiales bacterium]MDN5282550.1 hypothetical protein [Candidatus Ozemobacter sp.]